MQETRARRSGRIGTGRQWPSRLMFCDSARVVLLGLEQRRRQQQVAVEQLPLGAEFDGLVLLRPEDLRSDCR